MAAIAYPAYAALGAAEWNRRVQAAQELAAACRVCPRRCGVARLAGEVGRCGVGPRPVVASHNLHRGEEPCLSGQRGSGTVFFTGCSLACVFCQNFPISQLRKGNEVGVERLAEMMLELERRGAHNINFVTPSHQVPAILEGLRLAAAAGLRLPIVWNSSAYESLETLALLDGIVDLYLPDLKYADGAAAERLSGAADYVEVARSAIREMHRQVGGLELGADGVAVRGLLVRHLVLPNGLAGTSSTLAFLARELGPAVAVSIMGQYFPAHRAGETEGVERPLSAAEYEAALAGLEAEGLDQGYLQEIGEP